MSSTNQKLALAHAQKRQNAYYPPIYYEENDSTGSSISCICCILLILLCMYSIYSSGKYKTYIIDY